MQHTHTFLWIHIIWATKNRDRIFTPENGSKLFDHFLEKGKELKCPFEKLNIQPEHVHGLINLPTTLALKDFMSKIKGSSSYWLNNEVFNFKFSWQRGYGAYSVSASQLEKVKNYIANQSNHHKRLTFSEEYEQWKKEYGIFDD